MTQICDSSPSLSCDDPANLRLISQGSRFPGNNIPEVSELQLRTKKGPWIAERLRKLKVALRAKTEGQKSPAVCYCCEAPIFNAEEIRVGVSRKTGGARMIGVQQCGSVHICPHCSLKAAYERIFGLKTIMLKTMQQPDGKLITVLSYTLTVGRRPTEALGPILKDLLECWQGLRSGRALDRLRTEKGLIGFIDYLEYGHNQTTGHHPHVHGIALFEGDVCEAIIAMEILLLDFVAGVEARGRACNRGAQDLQEVISVDAAAEYIGKGHSFEAAGGVIKKLHGDNTRGIFDVVDDLGSDPSAERIVTQYASAFKGRRSGFVSKRILDRLGLSRADLKRPITQASTPLAGEVGAEADETVDFKEILRIAVAKWRILCARGHRPDLAFHLEAGTDVGLLIDLVDRWSRPFPPWEPGSRQEYASQKAKLPEPPREREPYDWFSPPAPGGPPRQLRKPLPVGKDWRGLSVSV